MARKRQVLGEFALIDWIRAQMPRQPTRVPVGIGDDAALVAVSGGRPLLVTVDMLLEGVHFDLKQATARQVGRKALAVNLSDMAAMAGVPTVAVVAVGLKRTGRSDDVRELFLGLRDLADQFGVAVAGGDTNSWRQGLVLSVTLLGEPSGRGPVLRRGARPGDCILVTGDLGGSILGKHLDFTPRVHEALALHAMAELTAMIDISDGLAADLGHLLADSACGAVLRAADVPVSGAAVEMAGRTGRSPLDHALRDGEDFELLMTMPADSAQAVLAHPPLDVRVSVIGHIDSQVPAGRIVLEHPDGRREEIEPTGYEHACGV